MAVHQQHVKNKPFSSLGGIAFILCLVFGLYCLGVIAAALQKRFGLSYNAASLSIWFLGGVFLIFFMYDRVLSYRYVLEGSNLRLDRLYGQYMRHARTIMFRMIEDCGDPEEMKKKYPGAHMEHYVRRQCDLPEFAIVHISDKKRYISVLQADETIRQAVINRK